jgi:hypothetical protein
VKLFLSIFLSCIFLLRGFSQNPPGIIIGGECNDSGSSLSLTKDNGFIIVGNTKVQCNQSDDIFLVKLNSDGEMEWSNTFGHDYQNFGLWVEQTNDNGFIITGYRWGLGHGGEDIVLLKTNEFGDQQWIKIIGEFHYDQGFCVKQLPDSGFIIAGYTMSFEIKGDVYIVRTNKNGDKLWAKNYGIGKIEYGFEVLPVEDNNFVIIGTRGGFYNMMHTNYLCHDADLLLIKINTEGDTLWTKTHGGSSHDWGWSIKPAPGEGYYCFGSTQSYGAGSFDAYLLKVDNTGNEIWHKTYGGPEYDYGNSMDIASDGSLYLLGSTKSYGQNNSSDIYLIKTNPSGDSLWTRTFGGPSQDYGYCVKAIPDGGCAVLGEIRHDDNSDLYLVRVDSSGNSTLFGNISDIKNKKTEVLIYPNPCKNYIALIVKSHSVSEGFNLRIYSSEGHLLLSKDNIKTSKYEMKTDTLPAGIYYYQVILNQNELSKIFSGKFIRR